MQNSSLIWEILDDYRRKKVQNIKMSQVINVYSVEMSQITFHYQVITNVDNNSVSKSNQKETDRMMKRTSVLQFKKSFGNFCNNDTFLKNTMKLCFLSESE